MKNGQLRKNVGSYWLELGLGNCTYFLLHFKPSFYHTLGF